jgi:Tol biopolymer transport system component
MAHPFGVDSPHRGDYPASHSVVHHTSTVLLLFMAASCAVDQGTESGTPEPEPSPAVREQAAAHSGWSQDVVRRLSRGHAVGIFIKHLGWSPDSQTIVFTASVGNELGLFLVERDGSGLTGLPGVSSESEADWSPDGKRIAFKSSRDGNPEIYTTDADGAKARCLAASQEPDAHPSWSPDGSKLAFASKRTGTWQLWILEVEDGTLRRLTETASNDTNPTWSPDGNSIAYETDRYGDQIDIHVVSPQEANDRRLTKTDASESRPRWSADSSRLLVGVVEGGRRRIRCLKAADGARDPEFSFDDAYAAAWAPDGSGIAVAHFESPPDQPIRSWLSFHTTKAPRSEVRLLPRN